MKKISFAYESEEENRGYLIDFQYNYSGYAERPDWLLDNLRNRWSYEEEWKEIDDENGRIYYGYTIEDFKGHQNHVFMGYKVSSQEAPQGIEFLYISSCVDEEAESCQIDLAGEEEYLLQWVKSIEFSGTRRNGDETDGE